RDFHVTGVQTCALPISAESTAMTTELFNQTLTTAPVALEEIDFIPTVTGTYYIGFHAYSAANMSTLYVGEISVVLTPTCFPPSKIGRASCRKRVSTNGV